MSRVEDALRITGDTRTKGVKTAMTGRDMANGRSIAVLVRNRGRHEWGLCSEELYTLLTLADEQRLRRPYADSYHVYDLTYPRRTWTNNVLGSNHGNTWTLDPTTIGPDSVVISDFNDRRRKRTTEEYIHSSYAMVQFHGGTGPAKCGTSSVRIFSS
jgi:hypothetical protein